MKTFKHIGSFMRRQRLEAGITQAEFSRQLRVHVQYVSNWERGLCSPPLTAMRALVRKHKIPLHDLKGALQEDATADVEKEISCIYHKNPGVL